MSCSCSKYHRSLEKGLGRAGLQAVKRRHHLATLRTPGDYGVDTLELGPRPLGMGHTSTTLIPLMGHSHVCSWGPKLLETGANCSCLGTAIAGVILTGRAGKQGGASLFLTLLPSSFNLISILGEFNRRLPETKPRNTVFRILATSF